MIFISYSSSETEYVRKLKRTLTAHNIQCWLACDSILPGEDYAQRVLEAIRHCDAFVLILSEASQQSIWVPKELDIALNLNKLVIPFHIDDSAITDLFVFRLVNVQRIDAHRRMDDATSELINRIQSCTSPVSANVTISEAKPKSSLTKKVLLPLAITAILAGAAVMLIPHFAKDNNALPAGSLTTAAPTAVATAAPSEAPTAVPTAAPTASPTLAPTAVPTEQPTATPTASPTPEPTAVPTEQPTATPTAAPTPEPTAAPTVTITSGQYHANGYCWVRWLPVEGAKSYVLERRRVKNEGAPFEPVADAKIDDYGNRVVGKDYTINKDSRYAYRVQVQFADGSVVFSDEIQILTGD